MEHRRNRGVLREQRPYLRLDRFQGVRLLNRKDNSAPGSMQRTQVRLRCRPSRPEGRQSPCPGTGILTCFPFACTDTQSESAGICQWLRID
jgi:hypothetical protein